MFTLYHLHSTKAAGATNMRSSKRAHLELCVSSATAGDFYADKAVECAREDRAGAHHLASISIVRR